MNEITINNEKIEVKEYKNERVVTTWDIAKVHNREPREITQNFSYVKDKLVKGEDYFIVNKEKISESKILIQEFIPNNVKEIVLFTESGYLMLVKTFNDELSWNIQRQLVKRYFRLKEVGKNLTIPQQLLAQAQCLVEIDNRITIVENKVDNEIRVDHGEQRKIQKSISIRILQRTDITGYIENKKLMFAAIYRDLKDRFGVASYRDIKRKDLKNCLDYISTWVEPANLRSK